MVTYEFENVPAGALDAVEAHAPLRPGRRSLAVSQDRADEKRFLQSLGLAVAPWAEVEDEASLRAALQAIGAPAILKTRRLGYDGRGQHRLHGPEDVPAALAAAGGAPCVLERVVPFTLEISAVAARGAGGRTAAFDPAENRHEGGILRLSRAPARVPKATRQDAVLIAARIMEALDHVGVLAAELFVTPAGLLVNEIAPRVHNTGHWTELGCAVDQFEQHVRAVAGWPLGDGARHADVEMENLIGPEGAARALAIAAEPGARLHLYGKAEARPGRKMGHVGRILGPAGQSPSSSGAARSPSASP